MKLFTIECVNSDPPTFNENYSKDGGPSLKNTIMDIYVAQYPGIDTVPMWG